MTLHCNRLLKKGEGGGCAVKYRNTNVKDQASNLAWHGFPLSSPSSCIAPETTQRREGVGYGAHHITLLLAVATEIGVCALHQHYSYASHA